MQDAIGKHPIITKWQSLDLMLNTATAIWLNRKFLNKKLESIKIRAGKNAYKLKILLRNYEKKKKIKTISIEWVQKQKN